MKNTTHLDRMSHCKTISGTNWSNRWDTLRINRKYSPRLDRAPPVDSEPETQPVNSQPKAQNTIVATVAESVALLAPTPDTPNPKQPPAEHHRGNILNPAPQTLHLTTQTLHLSTQTLHLTTQTLHLTPHTPNNPRQNTIAATAVLVVLLSCY